MLIVSLSQVLQCDMHRGPPETRVSQDVLHHPGHPPDQVLLLSTLSVSKYKGYFVSLKALRHEFAPYYVVAV